MGESSHRGYVKFTELKKKDRKLVCTLFVNIESHENRRDHCCLDIALVSLDVTHDSLSSRHIQDYKNIQGYILVN